MKDSSPEKIIKPNWLFKAKKKKKSQTTEHRTKNQHSWNELHTNSQKEHIIILWTEVLFLTASWNKMNKQH